MNQIPGDDQPASRIYSTELVASRQPSDHALARAAARGVMAALGVLYERHNQRVYAVCLRMTRNSAEAEDLTQDVFIHLLGKIGSFRGESRFTTWLHRLTVNLVLMHFRRKATHRHQAVDDLDGKLWPSQPTRQSVRSQIADRINLESALAQLPPGYRSVFILFDIEGYRHDEIAHLLGCSTGTSKSQLHRARMTLRRLLNGGHKSETGIRRRALRPGTGAPLQNNSTSRPRMAGIMALVSGQPCSGEMHLDEVPKLSQQSSHCLV
jgi:RNA polymerase sigma-70 factor (ECF subfamily)